VIPAVAFLLLTYLAASVPFGLLLTTLYGGSDRDLRVEGSGNIGATNVARLHGWRLGLVVLAYDVAKGLLPVEIARLTWPAAPLVGLATVAAVAFLGHCYPAYLGFRGGKGVATGAGAMLAIAPWATVVAAAGWVALLLVTRRSSLASLGATFVLVVALGVLQPGALPFGVLLALGVLWSHLPNLGRLVEGREAAVLAPARKGRETEVTADVVLAAGPAGVGTSPPPLWKHPEAS
jgi:glycerol-3-phosphate acyltransferase PlsY